jgi:hypothetical protein
VLTKVSVRPVLIERTPDKGVSPLIRLNYSFGINLGLLD